MRRKWKKAKRCRCKKCGKRENAGKVRNEFFGKKRRAQTWKVEIETFSFRWSYFVLFDNAGMDEKSLILTFCIKCNNIHLFCNFSRAKLNQCFYLELDFSKLGIRNFFSFAFVFSNLYAISFSFCPWTYPRTFHEHIHGASHEFLLYTFMLPFLCFQFYHKNMGIQLFYERCNKSWQCWNSTMHKQPLIMMARLLGQQFILAQIHSNKQTPIYYIPFLVCINIRRYWGE